MSLLVLPLLLTLATTATTAPSPSPLLERIERPTVRDLAKECRMYYTFVTARPSKGTVQDAIDVGTCIGYLGGYIEMGEAQMVFSRARPYCYPAGTNYDQLAKIFIDWVDRHPEHLDEPRFTGLTLAVREAFPCKTKTPSGE